MNTLIISGWGWVAYACAAAVALRHFKSADVLGMSTRRLPEFLNEVTGYKEIVIIGVGLCGNPKLLDRATAKLAKRKVKLVWISALPFPMSLNDGIRERFEVSVTECNLAEAVGRYYGVEYADLVPIGGDKRAPYHQLVNAAMYFYRNYQDEQAYGDVVHHMATSDAESKWSDQERQMLKHYKDYGHRELTGDSKVIADLQHRINQIAPHDRARVLIYGESGRNYFGVANYVTHQAVAAIDTAAIYNTNYSNTTSHEFGHIWQLVDQFSHIDDRTGRYTFDNNDRCLMSYDRNRNNSAPGFCIECIAHLRQKQNYNRP